MNRGKIIAAAILAFLLLIVVVQNIEPVEMDLLVVNFEFSLAGLLFIALGLGFVLGALVVVLTRRKSPPKEKKTKEKKAKGTKPASPTPPATAQPQAPEAEAPPRNENP
ncbi:LapA family protein [Geoalkalibacter halelectricus]|uniref:LapA family protein n=1 Tax=Geoalkalibacter halelectricus TaxID=2847045 RepID=A0ABY5ZHK7_9BACT|nr:LapA family protein [Geoalkalibacter halelectricus]MDO3377878.1 LapA family protein [Geoalkalibacter halelectricus]UWZ77939.1 LapA family protein [Geoalkalibacter halelectricus]